MNVFIFLCYCSVRFHSLVSLIVVVVVVVDDFFGAFVFTTIQIHSAVERVARFLFFHSNSWPIHLVIPLRFVYVQLDGLSKCDPIRISRSVCCANRERGQKISNVIIDRPFFFLPYVQQYEKFQHRKKVSSSTHPAEEKIAYKYIVTHQILYLFLPANSHSIFYSNDIKNKTSAQEIDQKKSRSGT